MSAQHLPTSDRLRHLRAMGLQPLLLRGAEQEPPPVSVPAPATSAASAQNIPKAASGQGDDATRTSPAQKAAAHAPTTDAADVRDTAVEGPRLRLWFADAQADALNGPHRRLLQDVLRSVGILPEQVLMMASDGSASASPAPSLSSAQERAGVKEQTSHPGELPILAFGTGAPAGSTRVAALARLRDPLEKRIAWPMLRALRRRLQGGS